AVLTSVERGVLAGVRRRVLRLDGEGPFFDGGVLAEEADLVDLGFDLQFRALGEKLRIGLRELLAAADDVLVLVLILALLGEEGGEGRGVALLECFGDRFRRFTDGFLVIRPRRWRGWLVLRQDKTKSGDGDDADHRADFPVRPHGKLPLLIRS